MRLDDTVVLVRGVVTKHVFLENANRSAPLVFLSVGDLCVRFCSRISSDIHGSEYADRMLVETCFPLWVTLLQGKTVPV